jgi:hypothetical protein
MTEIGKDWRDCAAADWTAGACHCATHSGLRPFAFAEWKSIADNELIAGS